MMGNGVGNGNGNGNGECSVMVTRTANGVRDSGGTGNLLGDGSGSGDGESVGTADNGEGSH